MKRTQLNPYVKSFSKSIRKTKGNSEIYRVDELQTSLSPSSERAERRLDRSHVSRIIIHHHSIEFTTPFVLTVGPDGQSVSAPFFPRSDTGAEQVMDSSELSAEESLVA